MKSILFRNSIFAAVVLFSVSLFGQQDPEYTQYMYNMSVINPAYATDNEGIMNLGALYRAQWAGIDGAPQTSMFFAHTPINDRVELGLDIVHDEIGDIVKETNLFGDFAYKLPVSENAHLSLGLKAGATFFSTDFNNLQLSSGSSSTDPAFAENINRTFANIGIGAYYFTDHYYVGLSTPNLLTGKHIEDRDGIQGFGKEAVHYFLTGGYVFDINQNVKLKPSFMTRAVTGAPVTVDVNANVLLYEKLEAGLGYRLGDAVTAMANFKIQPGLRVGYAYDYTVSNLGKYSNGSHEIMILFDLNILGFTPKYMKSPRFF
ncbi:MAG: type IX secretion system membrane protein PorP/SprF [Leeuwenhoekiella sp.]